MASTPGPWAWNSMRSGYWHGQRGQRFALIVEDGVASR